jgi:hypothetical protein
LQQLGPGYLITAKVSRYRRAQEAAASQEVTFSLGGAAAPITLCRGFCEFVSELLGDDQGCPLGRVRRVYLEILCCAGHAQSSSSR